MANVAKVKDRQEKSRKRNNDSTKRMKAFAKLNSNDQFWCETKTFSKIIINK